MTRVLCLLALATLCRATSRPHIILIIADDLGWNDVAFHGSNQIPTPNIDALAWSGLVLNNYYVTPICTPSRAALMTGKYPIHTGMQHGVIYGTEPRGLPLSEKLLPEHLRELGYRTHLVGKWHLGSYKRDYLPLNRGFDTHLGFWTGRIDMYDHTSFEFGSWGFDFRRGFEVAHDLFGQYATDVYTKEAVRLINAHNASTPLFLTVAHSAVHSGNPGEFLRAPDAIIDNFAHIRPFQRQKFAAMVSKLDESVGKVVQTLQQRSMLEHSIILFTTDNGGAAAGFNDNAASNYPLRGVKNTLWEGGVRGAGVLWSPRLHVTPRVARQRLHLVDWLPTLLAAAGANYSCDSIDGMSQWEALSGDLPSPRSAVLHNIDDIYGSAAITVDQWKLHKGTNYNGAWDEWYGPSGEGEGGEYSPGRVRDSDAGRALHQLGLLPADHTILALREEATLRCNTSVTPIPCRPLAAPCLFNIEADPCEKRNLADLEPVMLRRMMVELELVNRTALPAQVRAREPRADPRLWGRLYTNFGDYLPAPCALDPAQPHCYTLPINTI
ncbi:PREDICTED: arylsulfatase I [Papilio xuthus]|uniref:Arylsulfatase I n=1 Tax=Papilio xuthus TaxID=66420 RepID=A0AAJ7EF54_PAPXU|nr:PREDICTED: arylsulfatase I [Papilio xuthus]